MRLGINIDHIAVLREARKIDDPKLKPALEICQNLNIDYITMHLRKDRRHIQDEDIVMVTKESKIPLNLEISIDNEIYNIALKYKPKKVTIVPENREEVTTEGGLDLSKHENKLKDITKKFQNNGIEVFYFIDPSTINVELSKKLNCNGVELHTGRYSNIYAMANSDLGKTIYSVTEFSKYNNKQLSLLLNKELKELANSAKLAKSLKLEVASGHGLNYENIKNITKIDEINELNIGQSIIAKSIYVGLHEAITDMLRLINEKNSY